MRRSSLGSVLGLALISSFGVAFVVACVGDDPGTTESPTPDGGDASSPDSADSALPGEEAAPPKKVVAIDVAAGNGFACAALSDGSAICWGSNDLGQIAQPATGDSTCGGKPCRPVTRINGVENVVRVAAGGEAACAITAAGAVFCWGVNENGQLGHASATDETCPGGRKCVRTPSKVEGIADVVEVAISRTAACAVTKSGRVFCWGGNQVGQLGRGNATATFELSGQVPAFDTGGVKHIATDSFGVSHFCANKEDGSVWCWGRATAGELGAPGSYCPSGLTDCLATPTQVKQNNTALTAVESIAASDGATCVGLTGGAVWCWGHKGHAIADAPDGGATTTPKIAANANGLSGLTGSFTHVCGLAGGGVVKCWGENSAAQLGVLPSATTDLCGGAPCTFVSREVPVVRGSRLGAGVAASFAVTPEGKLFGWGLNDVGQLGHPATDTEKAACTTPCSPAPVELVIP